MPKVHHLFGGSTADVWGKCNASPYMAKLCKPLEPSEYMARGSRMHAAAETDLIGGQRDKLNPEDEAAVGTYVEAVRALCEGFPSIEAHVQHPCYPECGTTIDGYYNTETEVFIWDYKTGYHRVSERSDQLLFAAWMLHVNGIIDLDTQIVHLGIFQDEMFRWWEPTVPELIRCFAIFHAQVAGQATFCPGAHCKDCDAVHRCPKVAKPEDMAFRSDDQLVEDYAMLPIWRAMCDKIEADMVGLVAGGLAPGYVLKPGRKKAAEWVTSVPEEINGIPLWERVPLTPAKAAKLVGEEALVGLVQRPEPNLVVRPA